MLIIYQKKLKIQEGLKASEDALKYNKTKLEALIDQRKDINKELISHEATRQNHQRRLANKKNIEANEKELKNLIKSF